MHQVIEKCNSFTLTRSCCMPVYRQGVISKNDKFQTIGSRVLGLISSLLPITGMSLSDEAIKCVQKLNKQRTFSKPRSQ